MLGGKVLGSLDFSFLNESSGFLLQGAWMTIKLAFFTVLVGSVLGTIIAMMRLSKYMLFRFISGFYVEFLRGTPLLVQVYLFAYGITGVFSQLRYPPIVGGLIALSLNSGAYIAEIMRSGILSIDKGQTEAASSLGLTNFMTIVYVILPQAIKNILPALGNEFITVIKESSIVSIIGITELMYQADTIRNNTYKPFEPLIVVAIMYFVLTFTLSKLLGLVERKLRESDNR
jgi:His/Glu/Gln/Arg/opine family amino acid ABC transporter permease subunit